MARMCRFTGYEIKHVEAHSHGKTVLDVAVGANSIFTCGSDCSIAVWDPVNFVCKRRIAKLAGWVIKCILCPLEVHLLACATDRIYVFDVRSMECRKICEIATGAGTIFAAAWSPDNSYIATSGQDGTVKLWRVSALTNVDGSDCVPCASYTQCGGTPSTVVSVAFSNHSCQLLAASKDGRVTMWPYPREKDPTHKYKPIQEYVGHTDEVLFVKWNDVDSRFVSCGKDSMVIIWNPSMSSPIRILQGHQSTVYSAVFAEVFYGDGSGVSQRQAVIISAGRDQTIRMWSGNEESEGDFLSEFPSGTNSWTVALAVSADGRRMVSVTSDPEKSVMAWQAAITPLTPISMIGMSLTSLVSDGVEMLAAGGSRAVESLQEQFTANRGHVQKHHDDTILSRSSQASNTPRSLPTLFTTNRSPDKGARQGKRRSLPDWSAFSRGEHADKTTRRWSFTLPSLDSTGMGLSPARRGHHKGSPTKITGEADINQIVENASPSGKKLMQRLEEHDMTGQEIGEILAGVEEGEDEEDASKKSSSEDMSLKSIECPAPPISQQRREKSSAFWTSARLQT